MNLLVLQSLTTADPWIGFSVEFLVPDRCLFSTVALIFVPPDPTICFVDCLQIFPPPAFYLRDRLCDPHRRFPPASLLFCQPTSGFACPLRMDHWLCPAHQDYFDPLLRLPSRSGSQRYFLGSRMWQVTRTTPVPDRAWVKNMQCTARLRSKPGLSSTMQWSPLPASLPCVVSGNVSIRRNWSSPSTTNWQTGRRPTDISLGSTKPCRSA